MGNISEKISKLHDTKQDIARAIQEKGVKVYDSDTFRSYAEKIQSLNLDDYDENDTHPDLNDSSYDPSGDGSGSGSGSGDSDGFAKYKARSITVTKNGIYYASGEYEELSEAKSISSTDSYSSPDAEKEKAKQQTVEKEIEDLEKQKAAATTTSEKQSIQNQIESKTGILNSIKEKIESYTTNFTTFATTETEEDEEDSEYESKLSELQDSLGSAHTDDERKYYEDQITQLTNSHRESMGLDTSNAGAETQYYFNKVVVNVDESAMTDFKVSFYNGSEQLNLGVDNEGNVIKEVTVPRGGSAEYTGDIPVNEDPEKLFCGWNPTPFNVQSNLRCYAQFKNPHMGFIKQSEFPEIKDTWAEIAANGGKSYPIGSWKILQPPTNLAFRINDQSGYYMRSGFGMIMVKVAERESGTNSTWLSINPLGRPSYGRQNTSDTEHYQTNNYGGWFPYTAYPLPNHRNSNNEYSSDYFKKELKRDIEKQYLDANIPWANNVYNVTKADSYDSSNFDEGVYRYATDMNGVYDKVTDSFSWESCYFRKWLEDEFYAKLPEALRKAIIPVPKRGTIYCPTLGTSGNNYIVQSGEKKLPTSAINSHVWIPSIYELFGDSMKVDTEPAGLNFISSYLAGDANNIIDPNTTKTYDLLEYGSDEPPKIDIGYYYGTERGRWDFYNSSYYADTEQPFTSSRNANDITTWQYANILTRDIVLTAIPDNNQHNVNVNAYSCSITRSFEPSSGIRNKPRVVMTSLDKGIFATPCLIGFCL